MQGSSIGLNTPRISMNRVPGTAFVGITIEDLDPFSSARKTNVVVEPGCITKIENDDDIVALPFHPALDSQDSVVGMDMNDAATLGRQSGKSSAQGKTL